VRFASALGQIFDYYHRKVLLEWAIGHAVETPWAPWTEYDLYWVFAQQTGLWERYHMHAYLQCFQLNVWSKEDFKTWDPCLKAKENYAGIWAVVQSRVEIPGEEIWDKLKQCF
jgi:Family of unknown function (DUF6492)